MKKIYISVIVLFISAIQLFGQAEINTGTLDIIVNAYGRIRLYTPGDDVRHLQRATVLVGTSSSTVFDYNNDVGSVEASALVTPATWGDFQIHGVFDNSDSGNPPNVEVTLDAYGWANRSFTILKYNVKNIETAEMNAYIGLDIIPELNQAYGTDTVTNLAAQKIIHFHRGTNKHMGVKLLSGDLYSFKAFEYFIDYSVDANYWGWMTSGDLMASYASVSEEGLVAVTSQNAQTINANESANVYYALALADTKEELISTLAEAQQKYDLISGLGSIEANSTSLKLGKNVPNPFRNQTSISYYLPSNGKVSLKVYDQLGNEIAVIVNEVRSKGTYSHDFDANNLAPGLYYYTLVFEGKQISNKMLITK